MPNLLGGRAHQWRRGRKREKRECRLRRVEEGEVDFSSCASTCSAWPRKHLRANMPELGIRGRQPSMKAACLLPVDRVEPHPMTETLLLFIFIFIL